ncbi:DUF6126 family protein [Streptomyces sp. NPDC059176]|uniref:DUF6126 family protein n=1 Tax=unclassified Streptomyces TaxID=2593676 RepID=UPI0036884AF7
MPQNPSKKSPGPPSTHEHKFPVGLAVRLFAYLVAGHLFAGFLYLLFTVGGK